MICLIVPTVPKPRKTSSCVGSSVSIDLLCHKKNLLVSRHGFLESLRLFFSAHIKMYYHFRYDSRFHAELPSEGFLFLCSHLYFPPAFCFIQNQNKLGTWSPMHPPCYLCTSDVRKIFSLLHRLLIQWLDPRFHNIFCNHTSFDGTSSDGTTEHCIHHNIFHNGS